MLDWESLVKK